VGFEPKFLEFERAKAVHALDHAAIVIGTHIVATFVDIRNYLSKLMNIVAIFLYPN
jgi:hypothetical protein